LDGHNSEFSTELQVGFLIQQPPNYTDPFPLLNALLRLANATDAQPISRAFCLIKFYKIIAGVDEGIICASIQDFGTMLVDSARILKNHTMPHPYYSTVCHELNILANDINRGCRMTTLPIYVAMINSVITL
jgi:hypothetical protein